MKISRVIAAACLSVMATAAVAQTVANEVARQGNLQVMVHLHSFLSAEELATLRTVANNEKALALFVQPGGGHSAIAVAPGDGFIRGGAPVASATAISGLATTEAARKAALEGCNKAKRTASGCTIVLDVTPLR